MRESGGLKITIVGLKQAKRGFTFIHEGPLKECEACSLFRVCMTNLEPRRVYEVVEVLEKVFPCNFHEDGARIVRVLEPDLKVAIESRYAFPQGIITFKPQECEEILCQNYDICVPRGLREGDRGKILEVIGQVQCRLGRPLLLAAFHRVAEA